MFVPCSWQPGHIRCNKAFYRMSKSKDVAVGQEKSLVHHSPLNMFNSKPDTSYIQSSTLHMFGGERHTQLAAVDILTPIYPQLVRFSSDSSVLFYSPLLVYKTKYHKHIELKNRLICIFNCHGNSNVILPILFILHSVHLVIFPPQG